MPSLQETRDAIDEAVLRHRREQTQESHDALFAAMRAHYDNFTQHQTIDFMERTTK